MSLLIVSPVSLIAAAFEATCLNHQYKMGLYLSAIVLSWLYISVLFIQFPFYLTGMFGMIMMLVCGWKKFG